MEIASLEIVVFFEKECILLGMMLKWKHSGMPRLVGAFMRVQFRK